MIFANDAAVVVTSVKHVVRSAIASEAPHKAIAVADIEAIRANFPLALMLSSIAGASTGFGGLIAVTQRDLSVRRLGIWQGAAAGFMLSVSFFDLAPAVLEDLDAFPAAVFFLVGAALFALLKRYIPEPDLDVLQKDDAATREVLWSGLLTAAGISLHNFPEGVAVCVASLRGMKFGLPLAVAIGLHNIPEGMAVALPLYFATHDKAYAVKMAFLSGMAEPAGVLFVLALIHIRGQLTLEAVAAGMSAVAGIMVILSLIELMPQAIKHAGKRAGISATIVGLIVMTAVMRSLDYLGLGV